MKEVLIRAIIGGIFLFIAGRLLSPHLGTTEVMGLFFIVVAARV